VIELTLAEVKRAKEQLEQDILERVELFTKETGVKIFLIDISLSLESGEIYKDLSVEVSLL
jgi:hypothetical protein